MDLKNYTPEQAAWLEAAAREKREREREEEKTRAQRAEVEFCRKVNELSAEEVHAANLISGDGDYLVQSDRKPRPASEVFARVRKKLGWEEGDE